MSRFPAIVNRRVLLGASCWALSVVFFLAQVAAIAASTRPYSLATNYISDLGNTACGPQVCSPLHDLVNASFVVTGALHLLGAALLVDAWPRRRLAAFTTWLYMVAGIGLILAGANPENENLAMHAQGALTGLLFLNLGTLVFGINVLAAARWLGGLAIACGLVGLLGLAVFLLRLGVPAGLSERVADYPSATRLVVFGARVLLSARSARVFP